MNIQNNTNGLVEILNMVNMLENNTNNGSRGIILPTFDYATGSSTGSSDGVNVQCNWKYGSTGPADLVIFYGYKWNYSGDYIVETIGCPMDGKFNNTSDYPLSGGLLNIADNDEYIYVYCRQYNTGFTILDPENSGYTFNYVAYKFNHIN
jgi:hypothetical protein